MKESDIDVWHRCRRWGVRYVLGESAPRHARPRLQEYEAAVRRATTPAEKAKVPFVDKALYCDGKMKLIYSVGRYDLFEVQGWEGIPT